MRTLKMEPQLAEGTLCLVLQPHENMSGKKEERNASFTYFFLSQQRVIGDQTRALREMKFVTLQSK